MKRPRPKLAPVTEEMKEWSALLGQELATWTGVTKRSMFGMTAFYRKSAIFAALPKTKAFRTPQSIAFKLYRKDARLRKLLEQDSLIAHPFREDGNWISLELGDQKDITSALQWLERAYRSCC